MKTKQINKVISIVKGKNLTIELDSVYLKNETVTVSDLTHFIEIDFSSGVECLIPIEKFKLITEDFEGGTFSVNGSINYTSGKDIIKLERLDTEDFPALPKGVLIPLGSLNQDTIEKDRKSVV